MWKIYFQTTALKPQWGEAIFKRKIVSFVRNYFPNQLPKWVTCLLTQEKSFTNTEVWYMWKIYFQTTGLKMHKYSHSGVKPFLKGKLLVLWEIVSQNNFPNESHIYSHRRKALQTQKCDMCGKYFSKPTVLKMHKFCHSGTKPVLRGKLRI